MSFKLDGSLHHGKRFLITCFVFTTKTPNGAKGLLFTPPTDKPPWGFGSEENENQKGSLKESDIVGTSSGRRYSRGRAIARQEVLAKPTDRSAGCRHR